MRSLLVMLWLSVLSAAIVALFWRIQWVYNLPTPVPKNYIQVQKGQRIDIASAVNVRNGRPALLHFFNPDCPCSKFNVAYFRSLVKLYGKEVNFAIVPVSKKRLTERDMQEFYHLNLPIIFDTTLASRCGVYSTPQAVIINVDQTLYYRGNYNKSRYCTDKKTDYASMALDSLLRRRKNPHFDQYALTAYGCKFPDQ